VTRGRKLHADPPVPVFTSLPQSLAAKVELLLFDPVTNKPKYGGRSKLIEQLLREWVERQQLSAAESSPVPLESPTP